MSPCLPVSLFAFTRALGWSQEECAFRAGVHRTYVGAVERGEYDVTILTLQRLAKTLEISLQDAIRGVS